LTGAWLIISSDVHAADRHPPSRRADARAEPQPEQVFERAAEVFRLMSAPMRLKIISALCQTEKNVGELLHDVPPPSPT
jgi:ArsR family transcriptional regulator